MDLIETDLAMQLKTARNKKGYSQNDVATILHITRQSVSKWERGLVYPDLDNLVRLSDIYNISVDDLINNKRDIVEKGNSDHLKLDVEQLNVDKVNTEKYQNVMQGLVLITLSIVSTLIAPVGIVLPMYVIWRNSKYNVLYKTIIIVSMIAVAVSLLNCFILINDNWPGENDTTIYEIK